MANVGMDDNSLADVWADSYSLRCLAERDSQINQMNRQNKPVKWERKSVVSYNKWHNRIFLLNCNQHFGNLTPQQFPSAVW